MAHNIYRDETGKDCMFVVGQREDAWHLLGQRCDQAASWQDAITLAGLDWQVVKRDDYARNPSGVIVPTGNCTIFRDKDNSILGHVGKGFEVKQNADCFQFVDTLLEANGGSHYDSAGALGNGSKIWCSVRVPKADIVVGGVDQQQMYLIFATAHDGSMAHTGMLSATRPVCQNTLMAAIRGANAMIRVKHTKTANARLEKAKDLMTGVTMDAKLLETKLNTLATRKMTRESLVNVLNKLFPAPKGENANTTRRDNVLVEVLGLYESNDNGAFPQFKGTAYNLLNSITEYVDHFRGARITENRDGYTLAQARAENAVSGSGNLLKAQAVAVIEQETEKEQHVPFDAPLSSPLNDAQFLASMGITL